MSKIKVNGVDAFSFYQKSVKYVDIEKGRAHMSTVFLRPSAVKRYGKVIASAVEIFIDGDKVAEKSVSSLKVLPEKWWTNAQVTESAAVTSRDGYLLDRSETPFAFVNVDDYEVIK
jgi:hypothetical protein